MAYHLTERPVLPPDRAAAERGSLIRGNGDFNLWELDRRSNVSLARQIYLRLRTAILARSLQPGTELPSTRALASGLGVARSTVIIAYEQLTIEGYIVGQIGAGTKVSHELPDQAPSEALTEARLASHRRNLEHERLAETTEEFARSKSHQEGLPFTLGRCRFDQRSQDVWRKIARRSFQHLSATHLGYSDPRGLIELREQICDHLRATRAVRCEPWQILVTTGTQQGIHIAIRTLLSPGDSVWTEDPGYIMTHRALTEHGSAIHPIAVDDHGIRVADGICTAPQARAAFVTPSHQHPLGVILSMARRLELLEWAKSADAYIIEDDYDSDFRYDAQPIAALQGLDDYERVIYVGTFNKIMFPGIRIGFLIVPPHLVQRFISARHNIDRHPQSVLQPILSEFIRGGYFAAHLRRTRQQYREQRDILVNGLRKHLSGSLEVESPDQGMHLVARLLGAQSDLDVETMARRHGVVVRAMSPLYHRVPPQQGLLFGFSGYACELIPPAITRLVLAMNAFKAS